ncbi:MAG: ABC transporter ATP-binding protein [Planctomycetota bacterium]
MKILQVEKLGKQYLHADGPVDALRDVDLTIEEGIFATITGRSGAGKSTLLLALGGLIRPSSGSILFRDEALHEMKEGKLAAFRRKHVGFVMQSFNLIPYLTAAENVALPLALLHVAADEQARRASALLERVDLGPRRNHLPRELSVGQQQRVAIARAFANEPDLILADEPTGNLDPSLSEDILNLLDRLNREKGTTIVMVTHSPQAAARGRMRVHLEAGRVDRIEDTSNAPSSSSVVATTP